MTTVHFAIPGDLDTPTGGYTYDRQVLERLPACGVDARHLRLPGSYPFPSDGDLAETALLLAAVPAGDVLLIDGLAHGVLPEALLAGVAAPIVVMHHHPLGLETGLSEAESRRLLAAEKAALGFARHVIVSSQTTAETLRELGMVASVPVTVALPGIEDRPRAEGRRTVYERVRGEKPPHPAPACPPSPTRGVGKSPFQPSPLAGKGGEALPSRVRGSAPQDASAPPFQILSVGSIIPRKGYDILIEAFARLPRGIWRSTIAGSLDLDPVCAAAIKAQIERAGLADHITLTGALKNLSPHYAEADIYCLPSRYEGYGMAFAAALASGLPVIAARAGAVPETVPPQAGILVPVDDAAALADALALVMIDDALRERLSDAAWAYGQTLPRWHDTAAIIARVLDEVARGACP